MIPAAEWRLDHEMELREREVTGLPRAPFKGNSAGLSAPPSSLSPLPCPRQLAAGGGSFTVFLPTQANSLTTIQETPPMDLHHPIVREFPEHRDAIKRLKGADDHFRNLFDEYHRLDDLIYRIEEEIDFATDQEIEELKMRRAKLKDYIYHLIRHAPEARPAHEAMSIAQ
jgi:uncharacterized protein